MSLSLRRGFLAAFGLTVACGRVARSQAGGEEPLPEPAPPASAETSPLPPRASFETVSVNLEIARTDAERQKGLGGHAPLGETDGMLFVFDRPSFHAFWMKGMLFPLDLLWIEQGHVVHIEANVANFPPETPDRALPIYAPLVPSTYVLEVNAGFAERYGITVGSPVELVGV